MMITVIQFAGIVASITGLIVGTVALCDMIPQEWGVVGWMISLISVVRTLVIRQQPSSQQPPRYFIWRVLLACVATLCIGFLTAMAAAGAANPQAIGPAERISAAVFILVGVSSIGAAMWLASKSSIS